MKSGPITVLQINICLIIRVWHSAPATTLWLLQNGEMTNLSMIKNIVKMYSIYTGIHYIKHESSTVFKKNTPVHMLSVLSYKSLR